MTRCQAGRIFFNLMVKPGVYARARRDVQEIALSRGFQTVCGRTEIPQNSHRQPATGGVTSQHECQA